ncbi:hypothetical protein NGB36_23350 [Streptomyces sp. RB6PN25]|uniref:Integrase n=1 Tax=Streptomyces humicola TaxID=2953240 RepID=A0ABT1Q0J6_9ACTN|nr:hypothetical protein [Streptomyces humicola]MCQ4083462.1 hypothetical protein [Streptomyces humicola]
MGLVESPLRCKAHGGFGERPGETDWRQRQHRAPGRLNPHQGIANARPLHPLPVPITDPEQITRLDIRRRERLGGILHEYQHAA